MADIKLSKTLSFILRHGADKVGVTMDNEGFVKVDDLLALPQMKNYTVHDIQRTVTSNNKQRFMLKEDSNKGLLIRANQGHSIPVADLDLTPITDASSCRTVVHGTYKANWESIKSEGLKRCKRNHIHFASGVPGDNAVISGMRTTCNVFIFVDLDKALNDGFKFFRSSNGVILCEGDQNGTLPPLYFKNVVFR
jgi:2'-phosphotransferase